MFPERYQRAGPIFGQNHLVILAQRPLHLGANFLIVIDYEQSVFHQVTFWYTFARLHRPIRPRDLAGCQAAADRKLRYHRRFPPAAFHQAGVAEPTPPTASSVPNLPSSWPRRFHRWRARAAEPETSS